MYRVDGIGVFLFVLLCFRIDRQRVHMSGHRNRGIRFGEGVKIHYVYIHYTSFMYVCIYAFINVANVTNATVQTYSAECGPNR